MKGKAPFEGGVCDLDVSLCATAVLSRLSRVGICPLVVWHAMTPPLSHSRPSQFETSTLLAVALTGRSVDLWTCQIPSEQVSPTLSA